MLNGLSPFGEQVVREMNWLGMLVDLSHVSPDTMDDAIRVSEAPVIFSHSSARAVNDVPRNVPDNILQLHPEERRHRDGDLRAGLSVAEGRGVEPDCRTPSGRSPRFRATRRRSRPMKAAGDAWVKANPAPRATIADAADHIDHIKKVAGIDHVGLGGDFDGITSVVQGLEDVSTYPALTAELLRRGYKDDEIKKILGLNILRVMRKAEAVSARLQKERAASPMLFTQVERLQPAIGSLRIVALGDSTTAGTPGLCVAARGASRRARRRDEPVRLLAHARASRVGRVESRGQRRAQRPDPGALRA